MSDFPVSSCECTHKPTVRQTSPPGLGWGQKLLLLYFSEPAQAVRLRIYRTSSNSETRQRIDNDN